MIDHEDFDAREDARIDAAQERADIRRDEDERFQNGETSVPWPPAPITDERAKLINAVVASGIPRREAEAEVAFAIANGLVEDVRFEIIPLPEPDEPNCTHLLKAYSLLTGELLESFYTGDPHGYIDAFRRRQAEEGL